MKVKAGEFARMSRFEQIELIRSEVEKRRKFLEQDWNMVKMLKNTLSVDLGKMPIEQDIAYIQRLERKEMVLKKKIAAMSAGYTLTA